MATVVKKPNRKFFYAVFRAPDGRQVWRSTKTSDRKKAMEIAVQLERGEKIAAEGMLTKIRAQELLDELLRRIEPDETLLSASVEKYLSDWQELKKTSGKSKSSLAHYRSISNSFQESLGRKAKQPIAAVTKRDIEAWCRKLLKEGRSASTVNWSLAVLSSAMERAVKDNDLKFNPAKAVEKISTDEETEADERMAFSVEQVRSLLAAADQEWKGMILLAYHCGMRLSDAAGLTWDKIDLAAGTITFRQIKKTRQGRRKSTVKIVMHPDVIHYLEGVSAGDNPKQPIFPTLNTRAAQNMSESFLRLIPKAKIRQLYGKDKTGKGRRFALLSFHSLRHSFVTKSHAAAAGKVSQEVLKGMGGHSTDAAHAAYLHLQTEEQRAVVSAFESVL